MHATERTYRPKPVVAIHPPLRFLVAAATALLLATLIASSTAHGLALGAATAQSALGSPLRVVIPITAGAGELLQPGCFRLVPAAGDGSAPFVTARVSLERTPAPRLVVTTANAINEPAIRFSIRAECDGTTRRDYVLLLDPPESGVPAGATVKQATREPRQERLAPQPAAVRRSPAAPARAPTQAVQVPQMPEGGSTTSLTVLEAPARDRAATAAAPSPFRKVATTPALPLPVATTLPARVQPQPARESRYNDWYLVGAGVAAAGVIALAALFTRRRVAPEVPQWTRSRSPSFLDSRSFTDISAAAVTVPHRRAGATTTREPAANAQPKSATTSRPGGAGAPSSRPTPAPIDPTMIDTLLDAVDSDFVEERAVREAWAAARSDVERELDGNAILQAIEEAERDLHLSPPAPAQAAIERALEDDLLQAPRRH
jgi:hypothetical protein